MSWLEQKLREARSLGRYSPGETVDELGARLSVGSSQILKLDANENLFIPEEEMRGLVSQAAGRVDARLYPSTAGLLENRLASMHGISPNSVLLGNGSDGLIELLTHSLLDEGSKVVAIDPTFSIYRQAAMRAKAGYEAVGLKPDFTLDEEALWEALTPDAQALIICSPNNPTGNQFPREQVRGLIEGFKGLVILDEAYADYAAYSMVGAAEECENLVVLRTFSKAYGLAGIRLGYAVANEGLSLLLKTRYQMPYVVSSLAIEVGLQILENIQTVKEAVEMTLVERAWLTEQLNGMEGVQAFDSDANFVLFNLPVDAERVYTRLLERGIMVRRLGRILGYPNCLRVTVAPRPIGEAFLAALKEAVG